MKITNVVEVANLRVTRLTLYHEECYVPLSKPVDTVLRLSSVPDHWIDPGCALCGKALAVYPVDEQMERDFLRSVDEMEQEYVRGQVIA